MVTPEHSPSMRDAKCPTRSHLDFVKRVRSNWPALRLLLPRISASRFFHPERHSSLRECRNRRCRVTEFITWIAEGAHIRNRASARNKNRGGIEAKAEPPISSLPFEIRLSRIRYAMMALSCATSRARSIWCLDDPLPTVAEFLLVLRTCWAGRRSAINRTGDH